VTSVANAGGTVGPARSHNYGDMAAVLVRVNLDGVLASRVGKEGTDSIGPSGLPTAEIISEGPYPSLGIQTGFNCLLLADNGQAWMLAMGRDHRGFRCDSLRIGARAASATQLTVSMDPPERSPADVPPVTRWEWDSVSKQQLIGLKCRPRVWCTVGPKGHQAMPARVFSHGVAMPKVRGWIDEQYLADVAPGAVKGTGAATPLVVTPVVGTAYPAEHLADLTMGSTPGAWTPVAYVALSGPLPGYESKLGFSATPNASNGLSALNIISFCADTRTACGIPARVASCSSTPEMWAKVSSPLPLSSGSRTKYLCVRYRPHAAVTGASSHFDIPAVVRWRWKPDDETMWVRCPAGCCEVYGET
jgi:hypothetical protein